MSASCTARSARDLHEWRPPQVADFVRLKGSARYAPGQTRGAACSPTCARVLDDLEQRFPGPEGDADRPSSSEGRPMMPAFEVAARRPHRQGRQSPPTRRCAASRSRPARITPARLLRHRCRRISIAELGMEGIVCGPGGRYNTMPDERVDIPDFLDMVRIYLLAILDICDLA